MLYFFIFSLCLLVSVGGFFVLFLNKDFTKTNLHAYWFYFRWFLIGKYHCKSKNKIIFVCLNKIFWGIVLLNIILSLAYILPRE